jgi:hypothetical protein
MTVSSAHDALGPTGARQRHRDDVTISMVTIFVVAVCCLLGRYVAGPTLGVLWIGFASLGIVLPTVASHQKCRWRWLICAAAGTIPAAAVWAWTAMPFSGHGDIGFAALTLLTFAIACAGAASALARVMPAAAGSAAVIVIALAWLFWPIWLAHNLGPAAERISNALVATHPLLTMNERLLDWGVWTERPMTYRLTALGQDLPYSPPSTPWACIGLNVLIATPMLAIDLAGALSSRRRGRRDASPDR